MLGVNQEEHLRIIQKTHARQQIDLDSLRLAAEQLLSQEGQALSIDPTVKLRKEQLDKLLKKGGQ